MSILSDWYDKENFAKIYYGGLSGWVSKQFHKLLEHGRISDINVLLEVGATHGQHFSYVNHNYEKYILSDLKVSSELMAFSSNPKISVMQIDVTNMFQIKDHEVNRIISTCLLHHLEDINPALAEIERVMAIGGVADLLVPNDPSLLWNIGRTLLTFPRAKMNGWSWKQYWEYVHTDHVNNIKTINRDIEKYCKLNSLEVSKRKFPLRIFPNFLTAYFRITLHKAA